MADWRSGAYVWFETSFPPTMTLPTHLPRLAKVSIYNELVLWNSCKQSNYAKVDNACGYIVESFCALWPKG